MSELEIKRRKEYKRNRKRWSIIQIVAIVIVAAIALGSFLIYDRMNRTYYIEYTECSKIDYKVQYLENEFFEEEWIGKDQEYISSLVNGIVADFTYKLNMDTVGVGFEYKYKIDATLLIADKDSGKPYRTVTENLVPLTNASARRSNSVEVNESVSIDYNKYNQIAGDFVETYFLKNASCTLIVTLDIEVLSSSDNFQQSNENRYFTSLNIPLVEDTFGMEITSSVPESESKVLAYSGAESQGIFLTVGIASSALTFLLALLLIAFLYITKNEDVTYSAKVRKILNAYSSYIQRMDGEFNDEGYQTVSIKTFTEMLGIRDTIQSPILATENREETMTRFLIPTNTKILYVYEIKVDNYDQLYTTTVVEEPVILDDSVAQEDIEEALAQPDVVLSEIDYVDDDDEEFEAAPEEPGIEVIGVVWPERTNKNKVYRYDPSNEQLHEGDMVLVPTRDAARDREVVRKAAVAHANHRVTPEHIHHPLKKIIGVIKRKTEQALSAGAQETDE
ncbi:MAG: hypothetical protein E7625_06035 [Ruminococcaceae bacterium]|nr:hypothetical protein [Oscillospiraceae bacterium]